MTQRRLCNFFGVVVVSALGFAKALPFSIVSAFIDLDRFSTIIVGMRLYSSDSPYQEWNSHRYLEESLRTMLTTLMM
jgi:hypothetical protein